MEYRQKSAIFAYIQAGGRSSRVGTDKTWLEIKGRPMIEQVLGAARPVVNSLSIVINAANPQAERYDRLAAYWNARVIHDLHDHRGPLGGIHTALTYCNTDESALILACDMPFVTTEFLAFLVEIHLREASELTLPVDQEGRLQPLAGVYSASCLPATEQMLTEDLLRVDGLCRRVRTRHIAFQEYASLRNAKNLFLNINSLEEYKSTTD
ncbi:MAG: molybdenum cofactor guanylyltransferase [Acidobacteria bacterium]|nr:molybdenum cofactor guanylyltransferase [Acidobacteriota bacterium]